MLLGSARRICSPSSRLRLVDGGNVSGLGAALVAAAQPLRASCTRLWGFLSGWEDSLAAAVVKP